MSLKTIQFMFIQLLLAAVIISGQAYKAEYKKFTTPLIDKEPPIICILEEGSSLFDTLAQYPEFTKKYTCYSTEALSGLKHLLNVQAFNPEDQKFRQAVKNKLLIGYIINWKSSTESDHFFLLEIFSTQTSSRIYTKKFFPSVNSNPFEDVKKLLIDSMDVQYKLISGEIIITANPENSRFKLMRGPELVFDWKGNLRQFTLAGKYKLISEADDYITQETEIEVQEGTPTILDIKLEPRFSAFIKAVPGSGKISNIKTEFTAQQVKIIYDLVSTGKSEFDIKMELKDQKSGNVRGLKMISGDFEKVKPGTNKTIYWQMLQELGKLPANEYEIKITANKTGGVPWYYYAGGAALLGGTALLLGGGNENPSGSSIRAGTPPGRP